MDSSKAHLLFPRLLLRCSSILLGFWMVGARGDYKDDVGYTRLQAELGAALPTGAGVGVTQVEAPENSTGYMPDATNSEFVGKTLTAKSGTPNISGHATAVAWTAYGLTLSMAPGVTAVDVYEVNNWIGTGFLRHPGITAPKTETRFIQNHSWIGSIDGGGTGDVDVLRRLDYAIQQNGFLAVVGLNNGSTSTIPVLLANSYNALAVGLTNGNHSSGVTTTDGAGRVKPEIVSPFEQTSFATPSVSSAAALLVQKARDNAPLANAVKSITLKAILLAGATKTQFSGWSRTTTRPLDAHFGAGQLNVFHSYHVLVAGPQTGGSSSSVPLRGWDFSTTTSGSKFYFFDIPPGDTASGFSAALVWNRIIGAFPLANSTVPDLSLKIYTANGFSLVGIVDSSVSPVDNVEHLYEPNLPPGRYALEVTSNQASVGYALAWNSVPTVSVNASTPVATEQPTVVPGVFTITRAGDLTEALTVRYAIGGDATPGADYQTLSGTATIPAGANSVNVAVNADRGLRRG